MTRNEAAAIHLCVARDAVQALRASQIREVANAGLEVDGLLPFWFGESNRITPPFIREAAAEALARGATFYTHNLGIAPLRHALADYVSRLHGHTSPDHVVVTSAGVNALMLAAQLVVGAGDRVVAVTPLWPNLVEIPKILGARVETVALDYGAAGWTLDLDRLLAALTPDTRMVFVNSPNNPTGWVMTRAQQRALLSHCRRHGIWIVADEVYERLYFDADDALGTAAADCVDGRGGGAVDAGGDGSAAEERGADGSAHRGAPSFLDLASRDERVICVNSFSKAWLMTGWRLGWMVLPRELTGDLGKLIEYNTSCAPSFVQEAGVVAVRDGECFTRQLIGELREARDHLVRGLARLPGVDVKTPAGAMYVFFKIDGVTDSLAFCKQLVRDARLGLAPGSAFGTEGQGFVRWCYAGDAALLDEGVARLSAFLRAGAGRGQ
jgi:aspartate/methionine/tyrosine aminotransferase